MLRTTLLALVGFVASQKAGSLQEETHPPLSMQTCTTAGGCTTQQKSVVIDSNWRWVHKNGEPTNCYKGNEWDQTACPDPKTCTASCELEGAGDYKQTYGIHASDAELTLDFVTSTPEGDKNVGSRSYLMDGDDRYYLFKVKNKEFTFDVDASKLPCGLNGALYLVQMDADGGMSKYSSNSAGAAYGTGYCDAQCPHDLKFINGEANVLDWVPSKTDKNSGTGKYGSCCVEMDLWEANTMSTAYTAHACSTSSQGQARCEGVDCGDTPDHRFDGVCDKNGCDFQTYRLGNTTFYGKGAGFALDSSQPMTVITQFITADGTDTGELTEIRRLYKQNGKVIRTPSLAVGGTKTFDSISTDYCTAEADLFDDKTNFLEKGGMKAMDDAFSDGVVLVMSLWDDHSAQMLWLDSTYPVGGTHAGDKRGTCSETSGLPDDVESQYASASVKYSNIKFGDIGSTTPTGPSPSPPSPSPTPSGCPGGNLTACIKLCPSNPPVVYQACVADCASRCSPGLVQ
jgi:cellulose 1,4-beta-cellobiosidase